MLCTPAQPSCPQAALPMATSLPWLVGPLQALQALAHACWARDPDARPSFTDVRQRLSATLQASDMSEAWGG